MHDSQLISSRKSVSEFWPSACGSSSKTLQDCCRSNNSKLCWNKLRCKILLLIVLLLTVLRRLLPHLRLLMNLWKSAEIAGLQNENHRRRKGMIRGASLARNQGGEMMRWREKGEGIGIVMKKKKGGMLNKQQNLTKLMTHHSHLLDCQEKKEILILNVRLIKLVQNDSKQREELKITDEFNNKIIKENQCSIVALNSL